MRKTIKALSLFSGIGGLDLAAEAAGIKVIAFCEIDPFCRQILAKHWPEVPIFEDVFLLKGDYIASPVDIIHGGFPCQPFSLTGRQRGRDDERYLWPEFSRLVGEVKPIWVVAENVPGIFKNDVAGAVCADLEGLGYSVGIWNYEAACIGAPHHRSRVFFVGHAERVGLPMELGRTAGQKLENGCEDVSYSNGLREQQQKRSLREVGRRAGDVCEEDVAHAEGGGRYYGIDRENIGEADREIHALDNYSKTLPDNNGERCEELLKSVASKAPYGSAGCDSWWESEPDVGRVAYGVPRRVDRLRALGNAVVPQQAYPIFKAIVMCERGQRPIIKEVEPNADR